MDNGLWQAYCRIWDKCKKAQRKRKTYINIQYAKDGSYRLAASNSPSRESCGLLDGFGAADWACNVMYRLAYLGFFETPAVDAMFDELERTGYGDR